MAFDDIKKSIAWAQEGGRVFAYFTAHFATFSDDENKQEHDTVRYAIGYLQATSGMLAGELDTVFTNTAKSKFVGSFNDPQNPWHSEGTDEGMEPKPKLSYRLEVHADGTIGVQPKINGNPIGGMPVEKLDGEPVSIGLTRAASSTTAYAVSLDRQAKIVVPK
jgi:hypothetical protein